jgi:hypothetical protein
MSSSRKIWLSWAVLRSRLVWVLVIALMPASAGIVHADVPGTNAASLRAEYGAWRERLDHSQFQAPLYVDSKQSAERLEGDVYAVIDHPFATVGAALKGTSQWCDILILHLNVKDCRVSTDGSGNSLAVYVGGKHAQSAKAASQVNYVYRVANETADYVQILLSADSGSFGTRDSRILLEAVALDRDRTFVHVTYSYWYGLFARMAMGVYLNTIGRAKVGFTRVGTQPDGQPIYVGGVRGMMERNAMRYYLAVVAYLGALSAPPQEQFEKRLRAWFTLTEQHALQLHEIEQSEYMNMKRDEYRRRKPESPILPAGFIGENLASKRGGVPTIDRDQEAASRLGLGSAVAG